MITATMVEAIWARPHMTGGQIATTTGATDFWIYCAQNLCRGLSSRGAAAWINELSSRFSKAVDCDRFTEKRYPRRISKNGRRSILLVD